MLLQAPDLYLGYGAAKDSPPLYTFEYPASWEEEAPSKTTKSTMCGGLDLGAGLLQWLLDLKTCWVEVAICCCASAEAALVWHTGTNKALQVLSVCADMESLPMHAAKRRPVLPGMLCRCMSSQGHGWPRAAPKDPQGAGLCGGTGR